MRKTPLLLGILVYAALSGVAQTTTEGTLYAVDKKGKELGACPLKNTAANVEISGFVARVRVVQDFENNFTEPVEAIYRFPLSHTGAVDGMSITVGERIVRGKMLKRDEAKKVYDAAKSEGKTAGLLDQERPNIFTQAVANILPGESVRIEITYVEVLRYEDGTYEFVFPMTVGPRYTRAVSGDAQKIIAPIAETRAGHDVSINVSLNAGIPVEDIRSPSHQISGASLSEKSAKLALRSEKVIPNKDFILRYDVTGERVEDGLIAHRGRRGGFFTLILQPPDKIYAEDRTPKEIVFVLDTSGSMQGIPIEKAKEAMKLSIDGLFPDDTFNLITFSGDTHILFDGPAPATQANIEYAQSFLESRSGSGGTEMIKAVKAALDPSDSKEHLRIVCFMTDGMVGNDDEILTEIGRHPNARVYSFGIGSSVNRSLLAKMAEIGKGEVEFVGLNDDGSAAAKRFFERVRSPLLTDLSIEWNGLPVSDVYPAKIGDLFSSKPVVLKGRYSGAAKGKVTLKGRLAGAPYEREIAIALPEVEPANSVLASLWARQRIDELSAEALKSKEAAKLNKQITELGLEFGLMTQFTSFVAVEERVVNYNGRPRRVEVPVEIPEGLNMNLSAPAGTRTMAPSVFGSGVALPSTQRVGMAGKTGPMLPAPTPATNGSSFYALYSDKKTVVETAQRRLQTITAPAGSPSATFGLTSGKAASLPKPALSDIAKANSIGGVVAVHVQIDEKGNVVSAIAISGNELLLDSAVKAAEASKFISPKVSGKATGSEALITYNIVDPVDDSRTSATVGGIAIVQPGAEPITEPMFHDWRIKQKTHAWVFEVIDRLQKYTSPSANEEQFVSEGRARIRIVFRNTGDFKTKLLNLLFEPEIETDSSITGFIPIENLAALCEMEEVKTVFPRTRSKEKPLL